MIEKLCIEIDKIITGKEDFSYLRELIINVIVHQEGLPKKFVEMCGDIHEADTDTAEDEKSAKEDNLHSPLWFTNFLKETKQKNIEFWRE